MTRESQAAGKDKVQPVAFELAVATILQLFEVGVGRCWPRRNMHLRLRKFHQQIFDGHAVKFFVLSLVCIRHQTVVASGDAVFARSMCTPQVFARVGIEVAYAKGFPCDFGQSVVNQSPQDASTTFGSFVKKNLTSIQIGWKGFSGQFIIFELIDCLHGLLQCRLQ